MGDVVLKSVEKRDYRRVVYSIVMVISTILLILGTFSSAIYLYNEALGSSKLRTIFGYKPMIVISGSMLPTIQINSLNLCKAATYDDIEIGDIVVYRDTNGLYITHRAIDKDNILGRDVLITKGDNNLIEDAPVYREQVVGKIVKTWNGIAPILSDILPKYGKTDTFSSMRVVLVIILSMSIISTLILEIKDRVKALIFRDRLKMRYMRELIESEKRLNSLLDKVEVQKDDIDSETDILKLSKDLRVLKEVNRLIDNIVKSKV